MFFFAVFCVWEEDNSLTVEDTGFWDETFTLLDDSAVDEEDIFWEELLFCELVLVASDDVLPCFSDDEENSTRTEPDDTLLLDCTFEEELDELSPLPSVLLS